jgi:hypothetical protein
MAHQVHRQIRKTISGVQISWIFPIYPAKKVLIALYVGVWYDHLTKNYPVEVRRSELITQRFHTECTNDEQFPLSPVCVGKGGRRKEEGFKDDDGEIKIKV